MTTLIKLFPTVRPSTFAVTFNFLNSFLQHVHQLNLPFKLFTKPFLLNTSFNFTSSFNYFTEIRSSITFVKFWFTFPFLTKCFLFNSQSSLYTTALKKTRSFSTKLRFDDAFLSCLSPITASPTTRLKRQSAHTSQLLLVLHLNSFHLLLV